MSMNGSDVKGEIKRVSILLVLFLSLYATIATFVLSNAA